MRGLRWLLLLTIAAILGSVGTSYYVKKARQAREAPPPPAELPPNISVISDTWVHTEYDGDRAVVEIRAREMRQIREPVEFELEGVELRIFQENGYDRVRSALATFDTEKKRLYSEGEVEITLDVTEDGSVPESELLVIRTSGVYFETETGKATTDRPTSFKFARGEGRSVGATYEPGWHDLRMHSEVQLRWYGDDPKSEMVVEAGQLVYKDDAQKVFLSPWARFRKGSLTMEGADSVVVLEDGEIREVHSLKAHGSNTEGDSRTVYSADNLAINFGPGAVLEKIAGHGHARVVSSGKSAEIEVTANRLYLEFRTVGEVSVLDHALALGGGKLESRPYERAGKKTPPTRLLRSEVIKAIMQPGGEEVARIETHDRGLMEFLPNAPGQQKRRLSGERIFLDYGKRNQLQTFRALKAETWTEGQTVEGEKPEPPVRTWSDDLIAHFDPETGEMTVLEQWGNFRYEEGGTPHDLVRTPADRENVRAGAPSPKNSGYIQGRKAKAERASFETARNLISLNGNARVWEPMGSTSADEILMDQTEGRFTARGNVTSTKAPDEAASSNGMLQSGETVHATAGSMISTAGGGFIVYEKDAVLWQGGDRLTADRIEIDRDHGTLKATGQVMSRFAERSAANGEEKQAKGSLQFTQVTADQLVYVEEHKAADYDGNVHLIQSGLDIRSRELRAYFRQAGEDAAEEENAGGLDHTLADGDVRIVQVSQDRTRKFFSEHAEYYVDEEKVILSGGRPKMVDSLRGTTQGGRLTYYAGDDRLLVDGGNSRPAVSQLRKGR